MTGCWSKRELNEFAIVVAAGIDKVGDEYEITIQIVNPNQIVPNKASSERTTVFLYRAKGRSMFEAVRRLSTVTPRKPYFSHLGIMVIGEKLAKEGISQALDFFARDQELRGNFLIVVSDQAPASDILSVLTPLEKIPANKMVNSLKSSANVFATTSPTKFEDLLIDLGREGKNTVLTTIRTNGNLKIGESNDNVEQTRPAAYLYYPGMAVFKNEKMVGLLNEEESKGYNYIKDNIKSTANIITCPKEGTITTEVISSKTKVKGKIVKEKPRIELKIHSNQNIAEVDCLINLDKTTTIAELDKISSKTLEEIVINTLDTIQNKYKADVFGFGEAIYRSEPKAWKKLEKDWEQIFPELEVDVKAEVKTKEVGTIINTMP